MIDRGEVFDAELAGGRRPVVVVTRQAAIPLLTRVTVVAVTTTVRGHPAEVAFGTESGLDHESVANCDDLATIPKAALRRRRGALPPDRLRALDDALRVALGLEGSWRGSRPESR